MSAASLLEVLWGNQQVVNGKATEQCREMIGDDLIPESLVSKIVDKIDVPKRRVMFSPMTKPVEVLKTPRGHEIPGAFFALTRKLFHFAGSRWSGGENEIAFRIAREISRELWYDLVKGEDESTKVKPFRGLIYTPYVLVMLEPIGLPVTDSDIGVKMRYAKRVV